MADHFADRRVFITGGTGFIGRPLCEVLRRRGASVRALVRPGTDTTFLEGIGVEVVRGNVTDAATIDVGDAQLVIHGAAWIGYGLPRKKRRLMWRTNVEGTANVVQACRDAGANRFVHVSSVAAIGATPAGLYAEDRLDPRGRIPYFLSEYERTKWESHRLAVAAEEAGRMRSVQVLPGAVLGLGGGFEGLMRRFAQQRIKRTPIGDRPTGIVHVRDVVAGTLAAAERGRSAYLLSDHNVTIAEMFALFEKASGVPAPERTIRMDRTMPLVRVLQGLHHLVGRTPPISVELVRSALAPKAYDSAKARKDLGWTPDTLGHLEADMEAIAGGTRPASAGSVKERRRARDAKR